MPNPAIGPLGEAHDIDDDGTCWQCGGEGGYASCPEDCCPYEGGEEACDDPACWRRCDICEGKGVIAENDNG